MYYSVYKVDYRGAAAPKNTLLFNEFINNKLKQSIISHFWKHSNFDRKKSL